jgi:hypothetical protein
MRHLPTWMRATIGAAALLVVAGPSAHAQMVYDGNILWNNYKNGVHCNVERVAAQPAGFTSLDLYNHFAYNDSLDPQLADPYSHTAPSWVPAETSPASGRNDAVVTPVINPRACDDVSCSTTPAWAALDPVCFRGAVPPASLGSDWTQGWTYFNDNGAGRTDIDYTKPVVIIQGNLTADQTWFNTVNYLLRGRVNVLDGVTLTIEPGTVIFGESGTVPFLCIEMGAKIMAVGTPTQPIILTSDQAPGSMAPGDIAGIVLNGRAIANCADCQHGQTCLTEGTTTYHCGNNDCDSSGELRYFRSEYAGYILSPNNELNSITFCSVGINTRVEYCESFRGKDDLFEWFGGRVTCKYLVGIGGGDDCLDTQMGYRGNVQFFVAQQWGDNGADKGIEWDNNEFNYDAPCRNNPVITNCTFICTDHVTGTCTWGAHLRRGTDAQIYNSIFMGWKSPGLYVQDNASAARGFYPQAPAFCTPSSVDPQPGVAGSLVVTALNPAYSQAMFFVNAAQGGETRLGVYDTQGRLVHSGLQNLGAGAQTLSWNPSEENVPGGTYFYRVEKNGQTATGKLVLVR